MAGQIAKEEFTELKEPGVRRSLLKRAFTGGFVQISQLLQLKLSGLRSTEGISNRRLYSVA